MKKLITALGLLILVLILGIGVVLYGVDAGWFGPNSHKTTDHNKTQQETEIQEVEPEESLQEETVSENSDEFLEQIVSMREENDEDENYVPDVVIDTENGTVTIGSEEQEDIVTESSGEQVLDTDALKEAAEGTALVIPNTTGDTITVEELATANGMDTSEGTDGNVILSDTYQTARIVVNSEETITDEDAVSIAGPYNDTYVLQYEDEESAQEACESFADDENVEYAEPEQLCFLDPPDSDGVESYQEASENPESSEIAQESSTLEEAEASESEEAGNQIETESGQSEENQETISDNENTDESAQENVNTDEQNAENTQDAEDSGEAAQDAEDNGESVQNAEDNGESVQDAEDNGETVQDAEDNGEAVQDAEDNGEAVQDAEDNGEAVQDAEDNADEADDSESTQENSQAQSSTFSYKSFDTWGNDVVGLSHMKKLVKSTYGSYSEAPVIKVAVIDTGIDYNHPWFKNRLVSKGYDFVNNDKNATDDYMHGTVVSGVIAKYTSSNVKILPLKAGDENGSLSDIDVYNAIEYAIKKKVDVINMSFGRIDSYDSELLKEAVSDANKAGILLVAAYGNDGKKTTHYIPARYKNVIGVSAINMFKKRASFSNYGKYVDITAPGESIYTAYPTYMSENPYAYMDGTSLSAPFVSAACAMLKTFYPKASTYKIRHLIFDNAYEVGNSLYYGYGLLYLKKFTYAKN